MSARVTDDEILDAAVAAVVEHGYAGATTRQIARAAGINEVTLFRRFHNKQTLVMAAIHRDLSRLEDPDLTPTGDLEADLLTVLEHYVETFRRHPGLPVMLMLEATRTAELADLLAEPLALQARVRELIGFYQRSGELVPEPPAQTFNALIGPLVVYGIDARIGIAPDGGPPTPHELLDRFLGGHRASADIPAPASGRRRD